MLERYIFVFTFSIIILNAFHLISIVVGNQIKYPKINSIISPTSFLFFYPSLLWQVWYWSGILIYGVI